MSRPYQVRMFGDPVLRSRAEEIVDIDQRVVAMATEMVPAMRAAEGIGLAAPQVGIAKRLFVYDLGDGPKTLINPVVVESDGEWNFNEGCLSFPGFAFDIVRPKTVHIVAVDLDGNDVSIEADELEARLFQHELDHLDGVMLIDLLSRDERRDALRAWREGQSSPALSIGVDLSG